jgi:PPOX class probable F420-dependent enzyme
MWDLTTEFGQRVERRLAEEVVIWLVTTSADGTPQPSPVWFVREGDGVLIYSKPGAPKLRNLAARPRVALHFNTDAEGDDMVIFNGDARLDPGAPPSDQVPAYQAKYGERIPGIGMSVPEFATTYSEAIRVTLTKLRGY